jgi:carotenoid cleavage dioxygenase
MVWFAYFAGPEPFSNLIDYGVTDKSGKVTRRDRFAAPYAAIIHDFMVTRNYMMFPVTPLAADRARTAKEMSPVAWEPARGAFVGVMRRKAGVESIRWFETEPKFFLHTMNAWEDGEKIYCEVTEFPNPPQVFPNADGSPSRNAKGMLARWTIDLADNTKQAKRSPVDDLNSEMPRVDERFAGLPYRHGWYIADIDCKYPLTHDAIAHIDLKTGKRALRTFDSGDAAGEPVFVPRSASAPEGDGYIISVVYRAATNTSELLILNAQDIAGEPAAVVKVPRRAPGGHGSFVAA